MDKNAKKNLVVKNKTLETLKKKALHQRMKEEIINFEQRQDYSG